MSDDARCATGAACRERVGDEPGWAVAGPLCETEVLVAERDTRSLVYDYIDLEQLLPKSIDQALDTQSQYGQRDGHPTPLREYVEALQRRIWWVTTTWAEVLCERQRLADPPYQRRVNDGDERTRVRDGFAVHWAVRILTPRIADLARVGEVELADYPRADADRATFFRVFERSIMPGWEAVLHLSRLHQWSRSALGRTRRTDRVPGTCSAEDPRDSRKTCGGYLYRDEPRYREDPCPVYCDLYPERHQLTRRQYETYVGLMLNLPGGDVVAA